MDAFLSGFGFDNLIIQLERLPLSELLSEDRLTLLTAASYNRILVPNEEKRKMTTVAQMMAQSLYENGVRTVFGLPGGEVVEVLNAFRETGIEFLLVKNESSAIHMADVTARITGTIGVALTTLGPGAANAYTGIANAYLDRAPVLLISAQTDPQLIGKHTHQVLDLQACFRPVTKFTAELETESAVETFQFALSQLKNGRPGPVHLGICDRVAKSKVPSIKQEKLSKQAIELDPHITTIKEILTKSTRPIIVVGLGLEPDPTYMELRNLAEKIKSPVVDTPKAKGAVPASHPLFIGTVGLTTNDPAYEALDKADCIIAVGFDVVELVKPWSQDAPLIWIAPSQNQDPYIPAVHEYVGEMTPLLSSLTRKLDINVDFDWGEVYVVDFRSRLANQAPSLAADGRISPQDALQVIRDGTPDDILITTDVGSHKIFTALSWPAQQPNRYFVSNGLSTMGFGLPAAIAGSRVTQEPAICITGDAGLSMVIGELSLAIEMNLPVIVVMMNDNALDLIRTAQKRRDKPVFGTTFTNPNYALIAEGYGFDYHYVNSIVTCEKAIQTALKTRKPCLLDVQIDPTCYPTAVK